MNVFSKQTLLSGLTDRTVIITSNTHPFFRLSETQLKFKASPEIWSIAEIFEHLNISNTKCIHAILERVKTLPDITSDRYQSSWLGDWVYEKLMPKADGSVFKVSSPKFLHPPGCGDAYKVLQQFMETQNETHDVLLHAATKDVNGIRVPFYLTKTLKFRLGDTLRFLIAHNERHLLQAQRMMNTVLQIQNG